jgi:hypothetical protein
MIEFIEGVYYLERDDHQEKIFLQEIAERMDFFHFNMARRRISWRLSQNDTAMLLGVEIKMYVYWSRVSYIHHSKRRYAFQIFCECCLVIYS